MDCCAGIGNTARTADSRLEVATVAVRLKTHIKPASYRCFPCRILRQLFCTSRCESAGAVMAGCQTRKPEDVEHTGYDHYFPFYRWCCIRFTGSGTCVAGQFPKVEGDLKAGIAAAGLLNFVIFSIALWVLFYSRRTLINNNSIVSRMVDKLAVKSRGVLDDLRNGLVDGIIWPNQIARQLGIVASSVAMKIVSTTHFLWAGLAVGIVLSPMDYLFVMVFAGFALVLARFIRVPGGFVIGSGFALKLQGVPDETAIAMILLNHVMALILVVGIGAFVLWRGGVSIRMLDRQELV